MCVCVYTLIKVIKHNNKKLTHVYLSTPLNRTLTITFKSAFLSLPNLVLFFLLLLLLLAVLGLCCCTRAFSSCGERGLLFLAVRGLLIAVASLVAEHRL